MRARPGRKRTRCPTLPDELLGSNPGGDPPSRFELPGSRIGAPRRPGKWCVANCRVRKSGTRCSTLPGQATRINTAGDPPSGPSFLDPGSARRAVRESAAWRTGARSGKVDPMLDLVRTSYSDQHGRRSAIPVRASWIADRRVAPSGKVVRNESMIRKAAAGFDEITPSKKLERDADSSRSALRSRTSRRDLFLPAAPRRGRDRQAGQAWEKSRHGDPPSGRAAPRPRRRPLSSPRQRASLRPVSLRPVSLLPAWHRCSPRPAARSLPRAPAHATQARGRA